MVINSLSNITFTPQFIFNVLCYVWFIFLLLVLIYLYIKSIRPYKSTFNEDYYTELPSDLNIIEVCNLVNRKLNGFSLAASVLDLINRGVLSVEENDKKEKVITRKNFTIPVTRGEEYTIHILFECIGSQNIVSINEIYNFCNRKKNRNIMLMEFQIWCKVMRKENYQHIFFETKEMYGTVKFIAFCGIIIFALNLIFKFENFLGYASLIPAILLLLLFSKIYKRTRKANDEYHKWIAFRSYLENIQLFEKEVTDSETFLVYGTCLCLTGLEEKITNHTYAEEIIEAINRTVIKAILSGNRSL